MHGNENTAFYTNQDAPVDQSGDMMQQPVMSDAGHPPESKDAGSE